MDPPKPALHEGEAAVNVQTGMSCCHVVDAILGKI
jgi:hypothetical protein